MLKGEIGQQIKDALKSGDQVRLSTLRLLSSALHNEEIAKQTQLSEDDEITIVKRQLAQREEALEALRLAQGKLTSSRTTDLETRIKQEQEEAEILKAFLPEQMSEEQVGELVSRVISSGIREFGMVMKQVMEQAKGKADGSLVSQVVKQKLSS